MADDLIISGWNPSAEAPVLNSMLSLLELSSAFCRFQATHATEQLAPRLESFLQSGQVQSRVSKALANAATPQDKRRIQRQYDEAIQHARKTRLPLKRKIPDAPQRHPKPKGPRAIRPGGVAKEPRPTAVPTTRPTTPPSRDTFSRRWKT